MPALNFQPRFVPLIVQGKKSSTIRAFRKDGRDSKPGDKLYLYTGMRTKHCKAIGTVYCRETTEIEIDEHGIRQYSQAAGCFLKASPLLELLIAQRDGFSDFEEMRDWFKRQHGLPFRGLLIEFSPFCAGYN